MKQGKWICYPGDYDIILAEKVQAKRYQRDFPIAPFWRVDSAWHNIRIIANIKLNNPDKLIFHHEGRISVAITNDPYTFVYGFNGTLELPAGEYQLEIWVYNPNGLPCLRIDGNEYCSDESLLVGINQFMMVPCEVVDCKNMTPNTYHLARRRVVEYIVKEGNGYKIYDFGSMIFGVPKIKGKIGTQFKCYFGETLSEVLDDDNCEQIDFFTLTEEEYESDVTKAFRYCKIQCESDYSVSFIEEYDDYPIVMEYVSDNKKLEKIVEIAKRTFNLCNREFYLDGAKRDRWIWAGDAYQAFKIDYFYSRNLGKIKSTITALLGKSPVITYINHIMDYTMYCIMSANEYYEESGDLKFLANKYEILKEHMDFVLSRTNSDGFLYKQPNDWVFVDWNTQLDTDGEVCFEQILLYIALRAFVNISKTTQNEYSYYEKTANDLIEKINEVFWDNNQNAYLSIRKDGVVLSDITAYANIFACLYNVVDDEKKKLIINTLKTNKNIPQITTPYMQCYNLSCLFEMGDYKSAYQAILDYWGSMVDCGATTFWETYKHGDTEEKDTEMYGRRFGKSHCHLWGSGVLYLIPKYFFGLKTDLEFGNAFSLEPSEELIKNSKIVLPLNKGRVTVTYYDNNLSVLSTDIDGKLIWKGKTYMVNKGVELNV